LINNKEEIIEITYNRKTCKQPDYSIPQREQACSDAWKKIQTQEGSTSFITTLEGYYHYFLKKDWDECLRNFPMEALSDEADAACNVPTQGGE
jgi:hypothetical protein